MQRSRPSDVERAGAAARREAAAGARRLRRARIAHGADERRADLRRRCSTSLEKEGLERIDPSGEPFDPTEHEAVMHEPGDGDDEPVVGEVLRTGYRWKGRVLRRPW